jgi:hypothetical protein
LPSAVIVVFVCLSFTLRFKTVWKAYSWIPGISGGDHTTTWPKPVTDLLKGAWLAPRFARTASPPPKPCACTPSSSTAPKSASKLGI